MEVDVGVDMVVAEEEEGTAEEEEAVDEGVDSEGEEEVEGDIKVRRDRLRLKVPFLSKNVC